MTSNAGIHWEDRAWPELRLIDGSDVGLVPVGATEQHGPHLPTATDTIIASALCDQVSARTGALVLPAIPVGASYGRPLEFGTRKMAARPFLFPAFERSKAWIRERLTKAVIDGVLKATKA